MILNFVKRNFFLDRLSDEEYLEEHSRRFGRLLTWLEKNKHVGLNSPKVERRIASMSRYFDRRPHLGVKLTEQIALITQVRMQERITHNEEAISSMESSLEELEQLNAYESLLDKRAVRVEKKSKKVS